jgi:hypothetical protein
MAVLVLASCSSLPNGREEGVRVELPDEAWSVKLIPGAHLGPPILKVEVARDFPWPRGARGEVSFRVDMLAPEAQWIEGVGRITEAERFSVVGLAPAHLAGELDLTPEEARAEAERALAELAEFAEADPAREEASFRGVFELPIFPVDGIYRLDERAAWWDTRVRLVPVIAGLAVRGQEAARAPRRPTFTWGRRGQDLPEPCDDAGTPEDCVRLKAERFRDRICAAVDANQQPRFPDLCARLRATLDPASDPSFEVRCSLPHLFGPDRPGVTAGLYNPSEDRLDLSGEDFLSSACAEATLLHEVNHAQEDEADTYPELERFEEMAHELQRIDEHGKAAIEEGRLGDARRLADRRRALVGRMLPLFSTAGQQRVHSECNCFMLTLDNADLFGYPGDLAWVKETVKSMVFELGEVRRLFFMRVGTPAVRNSLGSCMIRLRAWIDAHADVKANLEQDIYRAGPPTVSWYQAIDRLSLFYSQ